MKPVLTVKIKVRAYEKE